MLMYKLQSTEDSSTWLVVRIRSAEDGHSSIQQGARNQRCSQTTGADKSREISGHQSTWQRLHVSTDDRSMCKDTAPGFFFLEMVITSHLSG